MRMILVSSTNSLHKFIIIKYLLESRESENIKHP